MNPDRLIFAAYFADACALHARKARLWRHERGTRAWHVREALRLRSLRKRQKGVK